MTFGRALLHFFREALLNLRRSLRVSLVAVLTIGVSLFVGGAFLLISNNLANLVDQWRRDTKIIVYMVDETTVEQVESLRQEIRTKSFVTSVELVSEEGARQRFAELFPGFEDLVEKGSLPSSLEIRFQSAENEAANLANWVEELRRQPGVSVVDDERLWLEQLATLVGVGQGLGFGLGLILFAGAVFTIASVIRLTAYLYNDEIAIMRLVGATEFFIRGPFYVEGLLQGLFGGLLAALALLAGYQAAAARAADSPWASLLLQRFLAPAEVVLLILLGGVGGLVGAVLSLRRERLGPPES